MWKLSATGGSSIRLTNADGNTQMESPSWWSQHRNEQHPRGFNLWPIEHGAQKCLIWHGLYFMPSSQNKSIENRLEEHFAFFIKKSGQVLDRIHPLNTTWVHTLQGNFSKMFSLIMASGRTLLIQWRVRELLSQCSPTCTLCSDPTWLRALPVLSRHRRSP